MRQRGPDLDRYLENVNGRFVTYTQGARICSMNYYTFVKIAREAGANIRRRRTVVVDLDIFEKYIESCRDEKEDDTDGV